MTETRRLRQHAEVLDAAIRGDPHRAVALALDHLSEFPDDTDVRAVLAWLAVDRGGGG